MQPSPSPAAPRESLPLVTVITATFNLLEAGRADFFRQCAESIRAQSYPAIEHLVLDGASTDGTAELLRDYEARGWLTVHSEPDKGIYDAFNKGLRLARGKYIAFLNSDDFWHDPRGVEASVRALEEAQADFSYAPCRIIHQNGSTDIENEEPTIGRFFCQVPFCHQTMFCRTELLREYGGFDDASFRMTADYNVVTRLILDGRREVRVPLNFTSFRRCGFSDDAANASLLEEECTAIYRRYYAPIIGEKAAEELASVPGDYPEELITHLAERVRPSVMLSLLRADYGTRRTPLPPTGQSSTTWTGPLRLPLLRRRITRHGGNSYRTRYSLFACLPLADIHSTRGKNGQGETRATLFGLLPLWTHLRSAYGRGDKHYLFGFIPAWGTKHR